jgi:hypothetical protein
MNRKMKKYLLQKIIIIIRTYKSMLIILLDVMENPINGLSNFVQ